MDKLTLEQIVALPVGRVIVDNAGMEWEQTAPGRWWDKTYPEDTGFKFPERGDLYYRYSPFTLKGNTDE